MRTRSIGDWAAILRTIGEASAPRTGDLRAMLDRCSQRGMDESWFLASRVIGSGDSFDAPPIAPESQGPQALLWKAFCDASVDVAAELERLASPDIPRLSADRGALLPQGLHRAIEVWTETELSCLHALWRVGQKRDVAPWRQRALEVARWHVTHLQPDNATNRPWAAHLFALLAAKEGDADAGLYAETLIHNCQVQNGRADPLSALILLDCAEALEGRQP